MESELSATEQEQGHSEGDVGRGDTDAPEETTTLISEHTVDSSIDAGEQFEATRKIGAGNESGNHDLADAHILGKVVGEDDIDASEAESASAAVLAAEGSTLEITVESDDNTNDSVVGSSDLLQETTIVQPLVDLSDVDIATEGVEPEGARTSPLSQPLADSVSPHGEIQETHATSERDLLADEFEGESLRESSKEESLLSVDIQDAVSAPEQETNLSAPATEESISLISFDATEDNASAPGQEDMSVGASTQEEYITLVDFSVTTNTEEGGTIADDAVPDHVENPFESVAEPVVEAELVDDALVSADVVSISGPTEVTLVELDTEPAIIEEEVAADDADVGNLEPNGTLPSDDTVDFVVEVSTAGVDELAGTADVEPEEVAEGETGGLSLDEILEEADPLELELIADVRVAGTDDVVDTAGGAANEEEETVAIAIAIDERIQEMADVLPDLVSETAEHIESASFVPEEATIEVTAIVEVTEDSVESTAEDSVTAEEQALIVEELIETVEQTVLDAVVEATNATIADDALVPLGDITDPASSPGGVAEEIDTTAIIVATPKGTAETVEEPDVDLAIEEVEVFQTVVHLEVPSIVAEDQSNLVDEPFDHSVTQPELSVETTSSEGGLDGPLLRSSRSAESVNERPKSPWTPSYSVTRQGSRLFDSEGNEVKAEGTIAQEEGEEDLDFGVPVVSTLGISATEEQLDSVPVVSPILIVELDGVSSTDVSTESLPPPGIAEEERPKSPWTPSYSVMKQGASPSFEDEDFLTKELDEESKQLPETDNVLLEEESLVRVAGAEKPVIVEPLVLVESDTKPAEPSEGFATVEEPTESTVVVDDLIQESIIPADQAVLEVAEPEEVVEYILQEDYSVFEESPIEPQVSEIAQLTPEPVPQERPKSPWTPSYSVVKQGPGVVDSVSPDDQEELEDLEQLPEQYAGDESRDDTLSELSTIPSLRTEQFLEDQHVEDASHVPEAPSSPRSELGVLTPFDTQSEVSASSHEPAVPTSPRLDPTTPIEEEKGSPATLQAIIEDAAHPDSEDTPPATTNDTLPEELHTSETAKLLDLGDDEDDEDSADAVTDDQEGSLTAPFDRVSNLASITDASTEMGPSEGIPEIPTYTSDSALQDEIRLALQDEIRHGEHNIPSVVVSGPEVDSAAPDPSQEVGETLNEVEPTKPVAFPSSEDPKPALSTLTPVEEDKEVGQSETAGLEPGSPATSRTRLESTASSRFFPGGWFSSWAKPTTEEHDIAEGEPQGAILKSEPHASEAVGDTITEDAETKKGRSCIIM